MTPKKTETKNKTCKAISFAAGTTHAEILKKLAAEWKKRNKKPDGSLNKNNYAPIYCVVGDVSMQARRVGKKLVLFGAVAECDLPLPKLVW